MNDYYGKVNRIIQHLDEKKNKKLQTDIFLRLCQKVGDQDEAITSLINDTYLLLLQLDNNEDSKPKFYNKSFGLLKKLVKTNLGYTPKGAIQSEYLAMGIALGTAFGSAFISINPAFISFGLPIGLAIGISIGKKKESAAEEKGNTY